MGLMTKLKSKLATKKQGNVAGYAPDSNTTATTQGGSKPMTVEERRRLAAEAADRRLAEQRARGGLSAETQAELQRRQQHPQQQDNGFKRNGVTMQEYREMLT
eukprot:Blabericola_migrator_1__1099@NODE_1280_length_4906_cov_154_631535_g498_i1_p5_GENE_NODE_1280_length_4906_cov_154_631535_g498_i1NODE_1280_length_4906_cov_154_631535_g498_i1_p5_ORF_typecomplete_len103_score14_49SVIP/PF15811_5/1_3e07_NODE_1280_length_4906_cov_154_631535_g498_i134053713